MTTPVAPQPDPLVAIMALLMPAQDNTRVPLGPFANLAPAMMANIPPLDPGQRGPVPWSAAPLATQPSFSGAGRMVVRRQVPMATEGQETSRREQPSKDPYRNPQERMPARWYESGRRTRAQDAMEVLHAWEGDDVSLLRLIAPVVDVLLAPKLGGNQLRDAGQANEDERLQAATDLLRGWIRAEALHKLMADSTTQNNGGVLPLLDPSLAGQRRDSANARLARFRESQAQFRRTP